MKIQQPWIHRIVWVIIQVTTRSRRNTETGSTDTERERNILLKSSRAHRNRPRSISPWIQMKTMKNLKMSLEPLQMLRLQYQYYVFIKDPQPIRKDQLRRSVSRWKTTTREKERTRALLKMKNILANITPIQSLQKMRFKMPLTDSIKEKQKTAVEYEPSSSKTVVTTRKKNQDNLQRYCAEGWLHTKKLAKDPNTGRDRGDAGNYRPICSLPVLYKLFATLLYARLAPSLHRVQPPDQAGFRPNHRCDDHLMVYRILEQRCREWGVPLYISTIDFTKAFDRIKHSALWSSLHFYGVKPAYVRLLQRLYNQQEGTVLTDKESDAFPIKRGTKQGDPLSSLLFNTVLQYSLENDLERWQEKQKGIRLSDKTEDCLTNLRFVDDVLLFSTSLERLREMLCEFKASTKAVGLGIHPDKTKILSNKGQSESKGDHGWQHQDRSFGKRRQCAISWTENHVRGAGNRRDQKQTESSVGQRSTNIVKNLPRKITDCATDFVSSGWSSRLHWPTPVERGH